MIGFENKCGKNIGPLELVMSYGFGIVGEIAPLMGDCSNPHAGIGMGRFGIHRVNTSCSDGLAYCKGFES